MTLYHSLMFREMKLTRGTNIARFSLYMLFSLMFITLALLGTLFSDEPVDMAEASLTASFWLMYSPLFGGLISVLDNGLIKKDLAAGWTRYSRTLPATPTQKTAASLMVKLIFMAVIFVINIIEAVVLKNSLGLDIIVPSINLFLAGAVICSVFTIIRQALYLRCKSIKDMKVVGLILIAVFYGGIELFTKYASRKDKDFSMKRFSEDMQVPENAIVPVHKLISLTGHISYTFILLAALIAVFAVHFIVMKKSLERREA